MPRSAARVFLLVLLLAAVTPAPAWGPLGHRLVAALAWDRIDPHARQQIAALLAGEPDPSLPGIANWADQMRGSGAERRSARWHYVNVAAHDCRYQPAQACRGGDCVVAAIQTQSAILADRRRPRVERVRALKFVVHLVADVHQPLHAGYAHDRGGNAVQIRFAGHGSNLHALWDSGLLNSSRLDEAVYLTRLRALPALTPAPLPASRPYAAGWAEASCRIVRQPGFYPAGAKLAAGYAQAWRPVAEARLQAAGAHLALVLNTALAR